MPDSNPKMGPEVINEVLQNPMFARIGQTIDRMEAARAFSEAYIKAAGQGAEAQVAFLDVVSEEQMKDLPVVWFKERQEETRNKEVINALRRAVIRGASIKPFKAVGFPVRR